MNPKFEEEDYVLTVPEKTSVANQQRHEKSHRQSNRDIRNLAHAILTLASEGRLSDRQLETLVEVLRRG